MKTIEFKSNFGRFAYTVVAGIGDDVNVSTTNLAIRGLADTSFRGVASDVEKTLVKAGVMTKETKRSEVEYSTTTAKLISDAAQKKLDEIAKDAVLPAMVFSISGEHEYGDTGASPMARATAFVDAVLGTASETQMRGLLGALGLADSVKADRDALIAFAHGKGLGVQPPRKSKSE